MSKWLNNTKRVWKASKIEVPCKRLEYCPYGQLVEAFPLPARRTNYSCELFGHECPVFYHAERFEDIGRALKKKKKNAKIKS